MTLSGQNECEIWVSDYLMSIERFLPKIERTCQWLREHLNEVQAACVEIIEDWVDEDDDLSSLSSQAIAETISITSISASNGAVELWAGTTIPIDHSLRVHLNYDGPRITIAGVSIEG